MARSGSGTLYTVEHFQAVRDRLSGQGVFCQWLPLHQLDLDTLRSIVQSFVAVYPGGAALLATMAVIASTMQASISVMPCWAERVLVFICAPGCEPMHRL